MTVNADKILLVHNLCKSYEGVPLLQDISFSLEHGEILCLLGPSGSGKTSLLRLIAGLLQEDSGTLAFAGRDLHNIPPHKRNFGMMFQEYALFSHKNVQQNIAFGLEMQQCQPSEIKSRIEAMLDLVGLQGFGQRSIDELSGGERQRVALARSLAPEPQLLLLDEPLGSLDRALRDRLIGEIRNILKKLAVTAIFVTHDQAEAFSVADRVAVLHNGVLQQIDSPEDLYRRPRNETVAAFLGFTNLIIGDLDGDGIFHCDLGRLPLLGAAKQPRSKATLLIRPEGSRILLPSVIAKPHSHLLSGTITTRIFQGSIYRVCLQSGGHALTFNLPIDPPPPKIGEGIRLAVHPEALVLLN